MRAILFILTLLLAVDVSGQGIGRLRRGNYIVPAGASQTPDTVDMLTRCEDSTSGTTVTATIAENATLGDSVGSWAIVANNGTTYPQVQTTQTIFADGVQISGGGGLGDGGTRYWYWKNQGDDRYPEFTLTTSQSTIVWGFDLIVSNFFGGSGAYINIFQVGISPYQRISLTDGSELTSWAGCALATHTGNTPGTGTYYPLTNAAKYRIVGKYESGVDTELRIYGYVGAGQYNYIATSTLPLGGTGNASKIRFVNEDDHGAASNGDTRQDNYTIAFGASAAANYPGNMLPNY